MVAAVLAAGPGCLSSEAQKGKRLQADIRRAVITSKSLGRFGQFALLQEEMDKVACVTPLSNENRVCEADVLGRGRVRFHVAPRALSDAGRVNKDAVLSVEYPAECENRRFDFKTIDNALPRTGEANGITVWESSLVRVTHAARREGDRDVCRVRVEVAPPLLEHIQEGILP